MLHVVHGGPSWHGPHLHLGVMKKNLQEDFLRVSPGYSNFFICFSKTSYLYQEIQETKFMPIIWKKKGSNSFLRQMGPFCPTTWLSRNTNIQPCHQALPPKKIWHSNKLSIHTAIVCQTAWNDLQRLSNCSVGVPGFRLPGTLRSFFGLVHLCPPGALATAFNAFGLLLPRGFRRREETMM